jgi:hypothetical protein
MLIVTAAIAYYNLKGNNSFGLIFFPLTWNLMSHYLYTLKMGSHTGHCEKCYLLRCESMKADRNSSTFRRSKPSPSSGSENKKAPVISKDRMHNTCLSYSLILMKTLCTFLRKVTEFQPTLWHCIPQGNCLLWTYARVYIDKIQCVPITRKLRNAAGRISVYSALSLVAPASCSESVTVEIKKVHVGVILLRAQPSMLPVGRAMRSFLVFGTLCTCPLKFTSAAGTALAAQPKEFFLNGLKKLKQRSHKRVELRGGKM